MNIQLTILCDNSVAARPGLIGEHGFACHISANGRHYLFDTGNGLGLLNNATTCGIDLTRIDGVLLSHGHWDHCGGLLQLLKLRKGHSTPVYAHPGIFDDKISASNGEEREIGTGFSRKEAEAAGAIFHLSANPVELSDGLLFSGEIPRVVDTPSDNGLCYRQAGGLIPDPVLDDQSLYLQSSSGLVVLCGCAHAGLRNILAHAISLTGTQKLHALIGGLHQPFINHEQEEFILSDLLQHGIEILALSHCTGCEAANRLINTFGKAVTAGVVSSCFRF